MTKILMASTMLVAFFAFSDQVQAKAVSEPDCYCDWTFTPNNPDNPDCENLDNPGCVGACEGWCENDEGGSLGGGYSEPDQAGQSSCQLAVTNMGNNIQGYTCETYQEPWPESGGSPDPYPDPDPSPDVVHSAK